MKKLREWLSGPPMVLPRRVALFGLTSAAAFSMLLMSISALVAPAHSSVRGVGFFIDNPDERAMAIEYCSHDHPPIDVARYGDVCGASSRAAEYVGK